MATKSSAPSSTVRHTAAVRAAKILHVAPPPALKHTPRLHVHFVHTHYVRAFTTKFRAH